MTTPLPFRAPHQLAPAPASWTPPSAAALEGTWHVTHSTLPMWRDKRNVRITYKSLGAKIDDLVEYQKAGADKVHTVRGLDTPHASVPGAWDWRGKGWLAVASSHWQVLGAHDDWAVTYFGKTLFTPAGIDVYARGKEGGGEGWVERVKEGLKAVEGADDGFRQLVDELFEVVRD